MTWPIAFVLLAGWAGARAVSARRPRPRDLPGRLRGPTGVGYRLRPGVIERRPEPGSRRGPWRLPRRRPRKARSAADALPEAVDAVAAAVRAGRSVVDGLEIAAAAAPPRLAASLREIVARSNHGVPVVAAVDRWARATDLRGAPLVAAGLGLAGGAGGDVATALAGVAETLRERRSLHREIQALSSQARLSALVITVAPVGFAGLAGLADGETARFLLASPAGLACLVVGGSLDLAGWRWMCRISESVR